MSKYQNYSVRQLLEAVRNGRTDVGVRAGEEIQRRIEELEEQNAALLLTAPPCCQDRLEALTAAAIAVVEGDADGLDKLKELLGR